MNKGKQMDKELKFCSRCKLEGIKSKLKQLSEDIIDCLDCKYLENDITDKITIPFTCSKCAIEDIKSELKNYHNHLLTCKNCQRLGKQIGIRDIETLI